MSDTEDGTDMVKLTYVKNNKPRYAAVGTFSSYKGVPHTEKHAIQLLYDMAMKDIGDGDRLINAPSKRRDMVQAEFEKDCREYDEYQKSLGR